MFWIVGAGYLVRVLDKFTDAAPIATAARQLRHVDWEGLTAYDVIFPLFVFLMGVSLVYSLTRIVASRGKRAAHVRLVRRAILLFALGVFFNGGMTLDWPDVRIMGVLQRIALCYLLGGLVFLNLKPKGSMIALVVLLAGYWAALKYVPAGEVTGSFEEGKNLSDWVDAKVLPGRKYLDKAWDPEGLLSTLPAVGSCLLGVLAGIILTARGLSSGARFSALVMAGLVTGAAGWFWSTDLGDFSFPIIKKIWTSSFVLLTGGISFGLLALFYLVMDVVGFRAWATPFLWIGANPLALYLSKVIIDYDGVAQRIAGGSVHDALGDRWGDALLAVIPLLMVLVIARFLYVRKIHIRV